MKYFIGVIVLSVLYVSIIISVDKAIDKEINFTEQVVASYK